MIKLLFQELTVAPAVESGLFHLGSAIEFPPDTIATTAIMES